MKTATIQTIAIRDAAAIQAVEEYRRSQQPIPCRGTAAAALILLATKRRKAATR